MSRTCYAFSVFTFDPQSGILLRNGRQLRMPMQTSLLLHLLVRNAGEVVSREQIQQVLWPPGECVDFEHAINRAVNNLRMVLRDDAQKGRFIETFSKRGYRFNAPVSVIAAVEGGEAPPAADPLPEPVPTAASGSGSPALVVLPPAPLAHEPTPARPRRLGFQIAAMLLVLVGSVLALGVWSVFASRRHAVLSTPTMVLGIAPFDAEGPDARQLSESFRLELMDTLSQLPGIQLRGSQTLGGPVHESATRPLAAQLHLDLLLLGKMATYGDQCRLQFELVRARDSVHLASFVYTGSRDELATIRDRMQGDLFAKIERSDQPVQKLRGSTRDPLAYSEYLHGRADLYQRTASSLADALHQYASAIHRDPGFARAYAGLATAYVAHHNYSGSSADHTAARAAAEHALRLDPNLAEAHAALGIVDFRQDSNLPSGEAELRRALELEPHQAIYHAWLAQLLASKGAFAESLHEVDLAHADDPMWPHVYSIEAPVAGAAHDFARALRAAIRYMQLAPASPDARDALAWAYFENGNYPQAIEAWHSMALLEHDQLRADFESKAMRTFQQQGIAGLAQLRLAVSKQPKSSLVTAHPNDFTAVEWYAFAGEQATALTLLGHLSLSDLQDLQPSSNPMLQKLRDQPRFETILNRLTLDPPPSAEIAAMPAQLRTASAQR